MVGCASLFTKPKTEAFAKKWRVLHTACNVSIQKIRADVLDNLQILKKEGKCVICKWNSCSPKHIKSVPGGKKMLPGKEKKRKDSKRFKT